jgi:hypothetical protein
MNGMGKVNKKSKQLDKLADEKARLRKREQMLQELKSLSIDTNTASRLKSVVTSNGKSKQKRKELVKLR